MDSGPCSVGLACRRLQGQGTATKACTVKTTAMVQGRTCGRMGTNTWAIGEPGRYCMQVVIAIMLTCILIGCELGTVCRCTEVARSFGKMATFMMVRSIYNIVFWRNEKMLTMLTMLYI